MASLQDETLTADVAGDFDQVALEARGVEYELVDDFALADIDLPGSRQVWEQVRPGEPLDEENIEHLRAVVENGGALPPFTVYRDNRGKWRVISGNHRTEVYRRIGATKTRAYVATGLQGLKFENGAVLALAFEANAGHGKQVSEAYRLKQALDLVHKGGYEIKDAARALSVPEGKLRDEKEKVEATQRLERLGVDTEPIPVTARRRIASIRSDRLATKLGKLVPLMEQKVVTVEETVKAVNAARSESEATKVLDSLSQTLRAAEGRGTSSAHGGT
jgi:ParB-like nuclease domain